MAKHLVSTVGVYYTKIIPTRIYKTRAGGRSIMMELEVIINPSLHMKKKLNRRITTNKQADHNFYQSGVSYHNYHYGAGEGAFHDDNHMEEEINPSPVSEPEVEEEEGEVSADSFNPLEGANDSGPDSDADGDEVPHDRVPIPY
ncbi:unnamed protein product [Linum trigynum]|uniref:Uncharacterized protein n=1 Tax=Linum trigynum TaxID=586398 RepID=A0AAV2CYW1_9ROSI